MHDGDKEWHFTQQRYAHNTIKQYTRGCQKYDCEYGPYNYTNLAHGTSISQNWDHSRIIIATFFLGVVVQSDILCHHHASTFPNGNWVQGFLGRSDFFCMAEFPHSYIMGTIYIFTKQNQLGKSYGSLLSNWLPLIYTLLFQQYTVQKKKETASARSWFALLLLLCFAPMVLSLKLTGWLACQKQSSWQKETFFFQMCKLLHSVNQLFYFAIKA